MKEPAKPVPNFGSDFKTFFLRGLAIVLPTVLTIWVIVFAYQFVSQNIAGPINSGVQAALMRFSDWPQPTDADFIDIYGELPQSRQDTWDIEWAKQANPLGLDIPLIGKALERSSRLQWMKQQPDIVYKARLHAFEKRWDTVRLGSFRVLNLIGLVLAIVLIYIAGVLVTSFIGRRLYRTGETLIARVPLIRSVYPAVKQVTDFFFGSGAEKNAGQFNRVVAVQYPRKGLWSVGLVTGDTMRLIETEAGEKCLTVFVPSSPTPFTGYVITVPKSDSIDLPITVEEALKFAVSGGVVIPQNQVIDRTGGQLELKPGQPNGVGPPPPATVDAGQSPPIDET